MGRKTKQGNKQAKKQDDKKFAGKKSPSNSRKTHVSNRLLDDADTMLNKKNKKSSAKKTHATPPPKASVKKDPFAKREAEKYQSPIASREYILQLIEQHGKPVSFTHLVDMLSLSSDDEERFLALKRRIKAMLREGQLVENRRGAYGLPAKMDVIKGRVSANPGGFGFLIPESGGDDLFLSPGQMKALFDGDIILAQVIAEDRRGRKEGRVVDILERNTHEVVGRCFFESGVGFLVPDNKKIPRDILLVDSDKGHVDDGQMVVVEITRQPDFKKPAMGKVIELLGEHLAPGMEVEVAIRSHHLPHVWPDAVEKELAILPDKVNPKEINERIDLRDKNFCTIDGEDARDFDDAIHCEKLESGWRLMVAIADVAQYVQRNSALDKEAIERGNSVYFPQRVIPMLPEKLSNGLCSLNPNVDRFTLVCEIELDEDGELLGYRFMEAVIHSQARLTYTEVAAFIDDGYCSDNLFPVAEQLTDFHALFEKLLHIREERGALSVESHECRFVYSDDKKIEAVLPVVRNVAHQMIEEAMLLANICAANLLTKKQLPGLFRIHEAPGDEKMEDLKAYLQPLGFHFSKAMSKKSDVTPAHFQEIVAFAENRPDKELLNTLVLRSMQQARYSAVCDEHFGLAYESYTHFTSPIRRYPDLLVHRALKYFIRTSTSSGFVRASGKAKKIDAKKILPASNEELVQLAEHCSHTERRADLATRDAMDWLKCEFMQDKVGEVFSGKISSVTPFGFFVTLNDFYIEGLVHISDLKKDYYHYDERRHELQAEHSDEVFCLADTVQVCVARVSLEDKRIEFVLEGEEHLEKSHRGNKPVKRKSPEKNKKNLKEKSASAQKRSGKHRKKAKGGKKPARKSSKK